MRTAVACALLVLAACAKRVPVALEFAEVVVAGTAGAIEVPHYDAAKGVVHVVDLEQFDVAHATLTDDTATGCYLSYTLTPDAAITFRAWTTAHVKRTCATMIGRRVVMLATVMEPLPGSGMVEFPLDGPERSELWELAERLEAR